MPKIMPKPRVCAICGKGGSTTAFTIPLKPLREAGRAKGCGYYAHLHCITKYRENRRPK